ncbi:MAG: transcriptional regulator, CopG family [Caulobacter sp.]|nr:transcriptional regulator, CopG family [Caulobacter sp.]
MASESRVFTAHIPLSLAAKVDEFAAQADRPRGWVVKQALADWVARQEAYRQFTLEGLADVDAGRVVPHEDIAAWVDSLPET